MTDKYSWEGNIPSRFEGGNDWGDNEWVLEVEYDNKSEDQRMRFVEVCLNVGERRGPHAAINWFVDLDRFDEERAKDCRKLINDLVKFEEAITNARLRVIDALEEYELGEESE